MKRSFLFYSMIFSSILLLTSILCSCEVNHTYDAEIKVVDDLLNPVAGAIVETNVSVNSTHEVYRMGTTTMDGKVNFSFNNIAILKVSAEKNNLYGEALLVLEEDKNVQLTVQLY